MKRDKLDDLLQWKQGPDRKPLIIKGARQVGKTWLVRELGKSFDDFVEFNFEQEPELGEIFRRRLDPSRIIQELSAAVGRKIKPGRTLLFFDEVQQSLPAVKSIRYFSEELPEQHLVAAGSLLNMVLDKIPTGVGRVSYLHLYPMTFAEFLDAVDHRDAIGVSQRFGNSRDPVAAERKRVRTARECPHHPATRHVVRLVRIVQNLHERLAVRGNCGTL